MEKEKKVGLTPLNWTLCIVGILFFMAFIVLPPMFRAFIPEDESNNNNNSNNSVNNVTPTPDNTPTIVTKTITCSKSAIENEEYRIIVENNETKIIAYTNESDYIETDTLNSCEQEVNNFINTEGLYNNCEINETKKIITYRITLPDYKELSSPLPFDYKSSSEDIKTYLTSNGFSCNEETT